MRMLFVGEAPALAAPEWSALVGPSGDRLSGLLGRDWREVADAVNLLDWHQRADANGEAKFPTREARAAARMLLRVDPRFCSARHVVLLGRRVASAFAVAPSLPYFAAAPLAWTSAGGERREREVLVVPHPSGRSRWWNDRTNRERAGLWFKSLTGP